MIEVSKAALPPILYKYCPPERIDVICNRAPTNKPPSSFKKRLNWTRAPCGPHESGLGMDHLAPLCRCGVRRPPRNRGRSELPNGEARLESGPVAQARCAKPNC